jgi:hypothetical protein
VQEKRCQFSVSPAATVTARPARAARTALAVRPAVAFLSKCSQNVVAKTLEVAVGIFTDYRPVSA